MPPRDSCMLVCILPATLLGLAGEQLGWQPVKAHHWPGEGRITFASRNSAALPDASALLALVKRMAGAGLTASGDVR